MILTPKHVHVIDTLGIPWTDCTIMGKTTFEENVAKKISGSDHYYSKHLFSRHIEGVTVSKNAIVTPWSMRNNKLVKHVSRMNEIFIRTPVDGAFEYDIFQGDQGITKHRQARRVLKELEDSLRGWCLERLVIDAYGEKKHGFFYVFEYDTDCILFAAGFQQAIQK